jgi:hypothetical protein
MRKRKGTGHGERSRLQLSNTRKDTTQLRFSKMGLKSAPAPDAIVADQMESGLQPRSDTVAGAHFSRAGQGPEIEPQR